MSVVLVTGASSGIGRATALALARRGHRVIASMRRLERGESLRREAARDQLPLELLELDVGSDASVTAAFAQLLAAHGPLDVLINNAGQGAVATLEDAPLSSWRQLYEVNVLGVVRCCQAALPGMRARGRGDIINVSSVAGRMASAGQAAYTASKFALEGLSEALANEVAVHGIRVSIVEPGVTVTPMLARSQAPEEASAYVRTYQRLRALYASLLRRASKADDVAAVIAALCAEPDPAAAPRLRWPVGADAHALIAGRAAMSDAQWLALGGDDLTYHQAMQAHFGLALAPPAAPEVAPIAIASPERTKP